jgi:DNA-binding transcriptional MerR regulator
MTDEALTLSQLAERSGVEARTLRSWMQQGVIPGPESAGRNARYAASTLTRVLAVKAMREVYGLSLGEIRRDLLAADEGRIAAYAAMAASGAQPDARSASVQEDRSPPKPASPPDPAPPPAASSAADYLRSLRSLGVFGSAPGAAPPGPKAGRALATHSWSSAAPLRHRALPVDSSEADGPAPAPASPTGEEPHQVFGPSGSGSRLAKLAKALTRIAGARPTRRKARGEVRLHIPITPDLDLVVRGNHSPEEIARFEQVADLLRTILTGGSDHD